MHEAKIALLDQLEQVQRALAEIPPGDGDDQGKVRPHQLLACVLDVALGLAHLGRYIAEVLDGQTEASRKGRDLLAHLRDLVGIVARKRLLPVAPGKLPMLVLECGNQVGDPIRVQS